MSEPTVIAVSRSPVRAFVHAGGATTAYLRGGHGAPVVLLGEPRSSEILLPRLCRDFRVFAPEVTAPAAAAGDPVGRLAFCRWLRAFLDGVGIERCAVVACAPHGAAALAFAMLEEERVERLVLLDPRSLDGLDGDIVARTSSPLLCLDPGAAVAAAEAAARFLARPD